jgi:hypothetical protein
MQILKSSSVFFVFFFWQVHPFLMLFGLVYIAGHGIALPFYLNLLLKNFKYIYYISFETTP